MEFAKGLFILFALTRIKSNRMYFYDLKITKNEQAQLLEMRGAFSIFICPFSIAFCVNNIFNFLECGA